MNRETSTFPISIAIKQKLIKAGFTFESDFRGVTPLELSRDAAVTPMEASQVLKVIRHVEGSQICKPVSAHELVEKELNELGIVTFSQRMDDMFGHGIPVAKITEFCGMPGIGKTQLSMQLCVDACIPQCFGGVDGEAIYIDTEGSFVVERLAQMASAAVLHCTTVAQAMQDADMLEASKLFTLESVLRRVHYFRCKSCVELIALSYTLPEFIKTRQRPVKMIAVDSLAFHFRHTWEDMAQRTRLLNGLAQTFIRMASDLSIAVVFVNQMTTKVGNGQGSVVPALGESWSHVATNRVLLFWQGKQRVAHLFKAPNRKEAQVPFTITTDGIRDIPVEQTSVDQPFKQAPKRQRCDS